jgi:hypothetical protein
MAPKTANYEGKLKKWGGSQARSHRDGVLASAIICSSLISSAHPKHAWRSLSLAWSECMCQDLSC